jgi:hypothetical protein
VLKRKSGDSQSNKGMLMSSFVIYTLYQLLGDKSGGGLDGKGMYHATKSTEMQMKG